MDIQKPMVHEIKPLMMVRPMMYPVKLLDSIYE